MGTTHSSDKQDNTIKIDAKQKVLKNTKKQKERQKERKKERKKERAKLKKNGNKTKGCNLAIPTCTSSHVCPGIGIGIFPFIEVHVLRLEVGQPMQGRGD